MLTYDLSENNGESLYLYIYECIRQDILNGNLESNYALPSKRAFASNLGVSNITVENAYAQLMAEGYIYSLPRKGFFVTPLSELTIGIQNPRKTSSSDANTSSAILTKNSMESDYDNEETIDLTGRALLPDAFPFSIWAKLTREILSSKQRELLTPPPSAGVHSLRGAIANYLRDFRDMAVAPEQIIIGAGTEYLYGLIMQLIGFDKIYGIENPGYSKIRKIYSSYDARWVPVDMDSNGINVESLLASKTQILHTSPSHHFPLGYVTPISRRRELINWLSDSDDRYIIEDDYDSEFRLNGKAIPTLKSIDTTGRIIYMNTFNKSLSSTIRISYMVLPPALLEQFNEQLSFYSCSVPTFEQYTLAEFLSRGYFEKHLNRMRTRYKKIKAALLSEIKNSPQLSRGIISQENGGLHFIFSIDNGLDDNYVLKKAKERGLKLASLSQYYLENSEGCVPTGSYIINYSSLTEEQIPTVVALLEEIL